MAWYYYAGGLAAAAIGYKLISGGASDDAPSDDSGVSGSTPLAAPLFMSGGQGGGSMGTIPGSSGNAITDAAGEIIKAAGKSPTAPTNDLPLGGSAWLPPTVPLSADKDVEIAKINAGVNMAAIKAATDLQLAGIKAAQQATPVPTNTTPSKTEFRGNSIAEGSQYIKSLISNTKMSEADIQMAIYNKAKAYNYSATEVAQAFSDATGSKKNAAEINAWLTSHGLSL